MKKWSDETILLSIKNTCPGHKHTINTSELTFDGFPHQPDFADIKIEILPDKHAIELQSVKKYFFQFRDKHISYERLLWVITNDFISVYQPLFLKITMITNPRGGISSTLEMKYENGIFTKV